MSDPQFDVLGARVKRALFKEYSAHPEMRDWEVFNKTLGFYQYKRRYRMTAEDVEQFRRGFESVRSP